MANIISRWMDRRRAAAAAEALYQSLLVACKQNGPRSGVDLPHDANGPLIVEELRKSHPEVKVVNFAKGLMLVFDEDLRGGTTREMYDSFTWKGTIK